MLLLRLILIFLILYIVLSVVKSAFIAGRAKSSNQRKSADEREEEEMVLDPQCQSYVPKSEAVVHSGKYFCSEECARRYLSR